ncbi:hypothetical protein K7W42_11165 [Deinococcus sp. HMF7604]|uniref:hypothetical protein n=1 Tax=Deinococcus betulae TaxID=2873312 RepID=UPI001CC987DC|nr:hypothetical protein [Deinococcus betulae]
MTSSAALKPMPVWLRLTGLLTCFLPLLAYIASALRTQSLGEVVGGLLFMLILSFFVVLLFLVPLVVPPICWLLGFRPGAMAGSGLLGLIGVGFLAAHASETDLMLGGLLCVHFVLCGVLAWEWRGALAQQQRAQQAAGPGPDDW